ncbi:STAS domain-containing protein [Amycolatopsis sp. NPDC098790]|uniref:STAS domain-containing protein n=1 Tax=Amycolatopsis sp. NPDC098790 TaxID=3363939 RepID=UPI0037FFEE26
MASFEVTRTADTCVVTAVGDLDLTVTDRLAALLAGELHRQPPALVCDASAVEFCAARILTILIDTVADAAVARVPFAVAGRRRALLRPITALGLDQVLPVHRSVEEAVNSLARARHSSPDARGSSQA